MKRAVAGTAKTFGRLDILVNAGLVTIGMIGEIPDDEFERALSVNVRGAFTATQEAVRHLGEGGRIIMLGSVNSDPIPFAGASVYTLTKAALAGFTHGLARDLGHRGITVNNIQPGPVDTDMNPSDGPNAEFLKGLSAVKRFGKTSEIAGLMAYLVSPEAGYITGAQIRIDGGFAA